MNPGQLSLTIVDVLEALVADGSLALPDGVPATVTVERPRQKGHGDYATNVALQLAKKAGTNPRALAELVAARLAAAEGDRRASRSPAPASSTSPSTPAPRAQVAADRSSRRGGVRPHRDAWRASGSTSSSSPPTRPARCTWAHTRWAVAGRRDRPGAQRGRRRGDPGVLHQRPRRADGPVRGLHRGGGARSADPRGRLPGRLHRRPRRQASWPSSPGILDLPDGERLVAFREAGYALQLEEQQDQLDGFNTHFDVWFSERALHDERSTVRADTLQRLKDNGHLFEEDGALWMRTTDFGDDKDRVLIRSNGELTYFASDTAYYLNKRARGFDHCIYLLGADHHGYVGRLPRDGRLRGRRPGARPST